MNTIKLFKKNSVNSEIEVVSDKSITHRAVIFASLSSGQCEIKNFLQSADCFSTINAFRNLGVVIDQNESNLKVYGVGINGLLPPKSDIDAGNSGTTARLICGVLASQNFKSKIIGDKSLSKRPMKRVIEPLRAMGANISAVEDNFLPMEINGNPNLKPIRWNSKISSAQVKSCILLAAMFTNGIVEYREPVLSRDHTERLMKYLKLPIEIKSNKIVFEGKVKQISPFEVIVPGDPSSASYFIATAILVPGSKLYLKNVCINPTRMGFIDTLIKMGAKIVFQNERIAYNEPVADILVESSKLRSIKLNKDDIPSMIDEIPLLAVVATQADGVTEIRGAKELRVKESDRIKTITSQLSEMGAKVVEQEDGMIIIGGTKLRPAEVESFDDHRIAMSLAVASSIVDGETIIKNPECVSISFPNFWELFKSI